MENRNTNLFKSLRCEFEMGWDYQGKIIVGRTDDRDGMIVFKTSYVKYSEDTAKGVEDLVEAVRGAMEEPFYTADRVQNGARQEDIDNTTGYIGCFPPLEKHVFEYLIGVLKKPDNSERQV
jgi:hypothetical protein